MEIVGRVKLMSYVIFKTLMSGSHPTVSSCLMRYLSLF